MDARERTDAAFHGFYVGIDSVGMRQPNDRLGERQSVLGTVVDFADEQVLALFGALALGDVYGDTADADHAAGIVGGRRGRRDTPAQLAVRPNDAEFRLI